MQHGRTFTLKFNKLQGLTSNSSLFDSPKEFPIEVLSRSTFFGMKYSVTYESSCSNQYIFLLIARDDIWRALLRPEEGDDPEVTAISSEFVFIVCCISDDIAQIPPALFDIMHAFRVVDKKGNDADASNTGADPEMEQIAALYGAKEIIRLVLHCD